MIRAGLAAAALLVAAPTAHAATYCVASPPGCPNPNVSLASALASAQGSSEDDTVMIGAGTFAGGPFTYGVTVGGGDITVEGQGSDQTTLAAPDGSDHTLNIQTGVDQITVRNLHITAPNTGPASATGLRVSTSDPSTTIDGVVVTRRHPVPGGASIYGIYVDDAAIVKNTTVDMTPHSLTGQDVGIEFANGTHQGMVDNVSISAATVLENSEPIFVTRTSMRSTYIAVRSQDTAEFINCSIYLYDPQSSVAVAFLFSPQPPGVFGNQTVYAGNVTVAAAPGVDAHGLDISTNPATSVTGTITSSIFAVSTPVYLGASGASDSATANVDHSLLDLAAIKETGSGQFHVNDGGGNVAGDPLFRAGGDADLRVRSGSPAVDTGDPTDPQLPPFIDLAGVARSIDGNNDGSALPDMGAFEYEGPLAHATAPATATAGDAVAFDASTSSSPAGRALTYVWSFDDGGVASGAAPSHAFANAGNHTGTVTVTDSQGLTSTATASVSIGAPPAPLVTNTITVPGLVPIAITDLKLSPSKLSIRKSMRVSFVLSVPATVTATLVRKGSAKRAKTKTKTSVKKKLGAGAVSLTIKGKGLKTGTYKLSLVAKDSSGRSSKAVTKTVKVTK